MLRPLCSPRLPLQTLEGAVREVQGELAAGTQATVAQYHRAVEEARAKEEADRQEVRAGAVAAVRAALCMPWAPPVSPHSSLCGRPPLFLDRPLPRNTQMAGVDAAFAEAVAATKAADERLAAVRNDRWGVDSGVKELQRRVRSSAVLGCVSLVSSLRVPFSTHPACPNYPNCSWSKSRRRGAASWRRSAAARWRTC